MLRRNLTILGFFNRKDLKSEAASLAQNKKLNILVGPPSSGKTALITEATKNDWKLHLDLRGYGTDDQDAVTNAFKRVLLDAVEPGKEVSASLAKVADAFAGSEGAFNALAELLHGKDLTPLGVIEILDRVLTKFSQKGRPILVFIDEYAELFSKGDPDLKWKDHVAHNLEKVLIKHTKQVPEKYVTAIITSSDQQYYDHFTELEEKEFAETKYLGYMPPDHVMEYLEKELCVKDVETRKKIADYAGGHFTVLQSLASSPNLDGKIQQSKMKNLALLRRKLHRLSESTKEDFDKLIPELSESGFVSTDAVAEKTLSELVSHNMVSLRGQTTDTVWSPDLPDAARKVPVVLTPFVPTQRHVLGDVQVK